MALLSEIGGKITIWYKQNTNKSSKVYRLELIESRAYDRRPESGVRKVDQVWNGMECQQLGAGN